MNDTKINIAWLVANPSIPSIKLYMLIKNTRKLIQKIISNILSSYEFITNNVDIIAWLKNLKALDSLNLSSRYPSNAIKVRLIMGELILNECAWIRYGYKVTHIYVPRIAKPPDDGITLLCIPLFDGVAKDIGYLINRLIKINDIKVTRIICNITINTSLKVSL